MNIKDLKTYLYPTPGTGSISSPTSVNPGMNSSGPETKGSAQAAYTIEISPEARDMLAASTGNRAIEDHPAAISGTPGAQGGRGAGALGAVECQTCKNREYRDGSNDPSVSFQTAAHIDPGAAESIVRAHEQEHVSHEQVKAKENGGEVVSQHVAIHYQTCPECGRTYVAGGTTTTVTRSPVGKGRESGASGESGGKGVNVFV
jgi:hypothetical protein